MVSTLPALVSRGRRPPEVFRPHRWTWRFSSTQLGFYLKKRSIYQRYYARSPELTPYATELEQLESEGITLVKNFMDADQIATIRNELAADLQQVVEDRCDDPTRSLRRPASGMFRLLKADEISPASRSFFEHELPASLAKAYVSPRVSSYQRMMELRNGPGRVSIADTYHFDDWRMRFKAFLYLTDVDEDSAPFVYVKGSHRQDSWRFAEEYRYYRDRKRGPYGHFVPQMVASLKDHYGYEEVSVTGPAGTMILFDARGIHRSTSVRTRDRLVLANYFDVREF